MSVTSDLSRSNFSGPSEEIDYESLNFDVEELDDDEYQIPKISEPPTLESILNEPSDDRLSLADETDSVTLSLGIQSTLGINIEGGSETQSVGSQRSRTSSDKRKPTSTAILRHVLLKGISAQINSAAERVNAGSATAVAFNTLLAVGTSHGLTLIFDSRQSLRWCLSDPDTEQGSVSSLSFNADATRLLVGFARGHILMFDLSNGKLLRTLTDVHPPGTAVLSLKFTDLPNLALCSDSGGSVFELSFKRTLGVRGCDTKCLFSGSRGEVCAMTPLLLKGMQHPLRGAVIVAMATLSKVIVVSIRPKLRVILVRPLPPGSNSLPLLAWQFVVIQVASKGKVVDPVLACAKSDSINFYQVSLDSDGKLRVCPLQKLVVGYSLLSMHWLNSWSLALLDTSERLRLLDIHSHEETESCDMSSVGMLYESSHFKGIFTGGNVSQAMARAGEKACYNTVVSNFGQLLLLGSKGLHAITIRPWADRLNHLVKQKQYTVALALGLTFCEDPKTVTGVKGSRERLQEVIRTRVLMVLEQLAEDMSSPAEDIPTVIQYALSLRAPEIIFSKLWDAVFLDPESKSIFLTSLEPYILSDQLTSIPPTILQQFVYYYDQAGRYQALEACILHLDITSLDLHQVTQICRTQGLYDATIFIQNKAFGDYISPLQELLPIVQTAMSSNREMTGKEVELGNKLLVYINCCLAGRGYPASDIPRDIVQTVKHDVFKCLTSIHSKDAADNELQYPYLRTLLHFDTKEFLNVVSLAFTEPEFTTELGLRQRQRLVDILLQIVVHTPGFTASEMGALFTFLARQLSRPSSGLQISPEMFHPVFEFLTEANSSHQESRQQTMLDLLRAAGLQGYPKIKLLARAKEAGFHRVCELIYEKSGEWDAVFLCYLDDPQRRPQVFSFLRNIFLLSGHPADVETLLNTVSSHVSDLLAIDVSLTAGLIVSHFLDKLPVVLKYLKNDNQKRILLGAVLYSRKDIGEKYPDLCKRHFEEYLLLTVNTNPYGVVDILKQHSEHYDVDGVFNFAKTHDHVEAQAYLLEKKGDFESAFKVLNDKLLNILTTNTAVSQSQIESLVKSAVSAIQHPKVQKDDSMRNELWTALLDTLLKSKEERYNISQTLQSVLSASVGYSNPSIILNFLLRHPTYSGAKYGDLRALFTGMLENSRYEATLASTCLRLVNSDLHTQLGVHLRSVRRGVRVEHNFCSVCGDSYLRSSIIFFPCGHPVHERCSNSFQCPVCSTIALDRGKCQPSQGKERSDTKSTGPDLKLQLSARPVPDLDLLN